MSKTHSMQVSITTDKSVTIGQLAQSLKKKQDKKPKEKDTPQK